MRVVVEKVGKRIYLRSPWAPGMPERCKSIGGRWSKSSRCWTYPLDLETCRQLRAEFGVELEIGEALWSWAANERSRETGLHEAGSVRDMDRMAEVDLPRVRELAPFMWSAMLNRPYQPIASLYVSVAGQSLLADQPGTGKTIETIGGLVEAGKKGSVLVLAPKTSCSVVWEPELNSWLRDYKHGFTVTNLANKTGKKLEQALAGHFDSAAQNPEGLHFLIVNGEMTRVDHKGMVCPEGICDGYQDWCPEIEKHKGGKDPKHPWLFWTKGPRGGKRKMRWSALIADETHKWLINTRGKNASQQGYGFAHLATEEDNFRVAITGTPLKGKKINLFGTLNWLRPDVYTSKWRWVEQHFDVEDGEHGGKVINGMKQDTASFFRSLGSIMIRRTKAELRAVNPKWMPPEKVYHDVWVDMPPKQAKLYREMERKSEVKLESGTLQANGTLAEFTRLKQFAGMAGDLDGEKFKPALPSGKFDWLLQFLEDRGIDQRVGSQRYGDLGDDVMKVVVASQFTSMIEVWSAELTRLGIRSFMLTGNTKDSDRVRFVEQFQSRPDVRVFLINTTAGGVSITLDAADDIVIMDETWVPDEQEQVEDRVHRASNIEHQVDVWYVRSKDTVEERIANVNIEKGKSNHVVLDAQRGLAFARQIMKEK